MRHLIKDKPSPLAFPSAGALVALVSFAGTPFVRGAFLARDFVEVVLTSASHFRIPIEKRCVHRHQRMFLRIDYNIIDAVPGQQAHGVGSASVDALYLCFPRTILKPVRPDMAGITHQRT